MYNIDAVIMIITSSIGIGASGLYVLQLLHQRRLDDE